MSYCNLCEVTVTVGALKGPHYHSKRHQRLLVLNRNSSVKEKPKTVAKQCGLNKTTHSTKTKTSLTSRIESSANPVTESLKMSSAHCGVCNVILQRNNAHSHYGSKKHRKRLAAYQQIFLRVLENLEMTFSSKIQRSKTDPWNLLSKEYLSAPTPVLQLGHSSNSKPKKQVDASQHQSMLMMIDDKGISIVSRSWENTPPLNNPNYSFLMTLTQCQLCNVNLTPIAAKLHYNSTRHNNQLLHYQQNQPLDNHNILILTFLPIAHRNVYKQSDIGLPTMLPSGPQVNRSFRRLKLPIKLGNYFDLMSTTSYCYLCDFEVCSPGTHCRYYDQNHLLEESPDPASLVSIFSYWDNLNAPHYSSFCGSSERSQRRFQHSTLENSDLVTCLLCHLDLPRSQAKGHVKRFPHADLAPVKADLIRLGITKEFYYFKKGFNHPKHVTCLVCSVLLRSGDNIRSHFKSRLHQKNFRIWCGKELAQKNHHIPKWLTKWHFCETCHTALDGTSDAEEHYSEGVCPRRTVHGQVFDDSCQRNVGTTTLAPNNPPSLRNRRRLHYSAPQTATGDQAEKRDTSESLNLKKQIVLELHELADKLFFDRKFFRDECLDHLKNINTAIKDILKDH